ncbi:Fcf2 pre-rRNA processing-domain-containing protein [Aspergillus crustosus]
MGTSPAHNKILRHDESELMDDDITQLLDEAEERLLKGESTGNHTSQNPVANIPKLSSEPSLQPYVQYHKDFAMIGAARILDTVVSIGPPPLAEDLKASQTTSNKDKPTAGSDWFDLPQTNLTSELRRDLQLLRMRSILDPKRHYKKENGKAHTPKYSQIGTIIEGPTEYLSGRIVKRDRKKTFVEEALDLEKEAKRFESRYNDVQDRKRSGKKAFYRKLRDKRTGGKNRH